jgi:hypothetical protein
LQTVANTNSTTDQQFAVTMVILPSDSVAGLADYHLRATQTDTYQSYKPSYLPAGATAFHTVSGPPGITLFWPHGSQVAELAASTEGAATQDSLDSVLARALQNWQWK